MKLNLEKITLKKRSIASRMIESKHISEPTIKITDGISIFILDTKATPRSLSRVSG